MRDNVLLMNRNAQLMRRSGYSLFVDTVAGDYCRRPSRMTNADINFWHKRLDEWEALSETEKCQYDVLAVLEQV